MTRHARLLSRALAGALTALAIGAPAAAQAECQGQSFSQVFAPWGDFAPYTLVPGGDAEFAGHGWQTSGGARVVLENNSHQVGDQLLQLSSLELGPGATATTPPVCVDRTYPFARAFARTVAGAEALQVDVLYADGKVRSGGTVPVTPTWEPTPRIQMAAGQFGARSSARYRFRAPATATWRIDDVYVDPRLRD